MILYNWVIVLNWSCSKSKMKKKCFTDQATRKRDSYGSSAKEEPYAFFSIFILRIENKKAMYVLTYN